MMKYIHSRNPARKELSLNSMKSWIDLSNYFLSEVWKELRKKVGKFLQALIFWFTASALGIIAISAVVYIIYMLVATQPLARLFFGTAMVIASLIAILVAFASWLKRMFTKKKV